MFKLGNPAVSSRMLAGRLGLLGIFLLALVLRIPALSSYPSGFTPDEASFGYDAYSILKTGRDQWGHAMPLVLESFGDFKLPLYSYILIPFVGLFGLSEWVVRFPNALLGSFAVVVVYYLARELGRSGRLDRYGKGDGLALIAALLLSVSPWHVMMSRGGFEANLTTFLMSLGIYLFLRGVRPLAHKVYGLGEDIKRKKNEKWLLVSAIVFGLNLFSYHSARLVTPFIVLTLLVLWRKEFLKVSRRYILGFLGILGVFGILMLYTFSFGAGTRVADISVFGGAMEAAAGPRLDAINSGMSPTLAKVLHNKFVVAGDRFFRNYVQYYSPKFLFVDGPAEATYGMMPGRGVLYLFEVVLLFGFLVGMVREFSEMWREKLSWIETGDRGMILVLVWILIAAVPAALAMGVGYAGNRAVIMIPAIQIAMAIGAAILYKLLTRSDLVKKYRKMLVVAFVVIVMFFVKDFVHQYFSEQPLIGAPSMLYGRAQAVKFTNQYDSVIMSKSLSEPHIYVAFYNSWDPTDYQRTSMDWSRYKNEGRLFVDQLDEYSLGKYTFTSLDREDYDYSKAILVGKSGEFESETNVVSTIDYPSGESAIYIINNE